MLVFTPYNLLIYGFLPFSYWRFACLLFVFVYYLFVCKWVFEARETSPFQFQQCNNKSHFTFSSLFVRVFVRMCSLDFFFKENLIYNNNKILFAFYSLARSRKKRKRRLRLRRTYTRLNIICFTSRQFNLEERTHTHTNTLKYILY